MRNLIAILIILTPVNAQAYIDPGTGSFFIQMLFASVVGGLFTIKMYFQKIKSFFKRKLNALEVREYSEEKKGDEIK